MASMTSDQLRDYEARQLKKRIKAGDGVEDEGDLHNDIIEFCNARGWIPLHGSMAHSTHRTVGEWDFTIVADNGRVFFIECKADGGKLSTEQAGMVMWAKRLGHTVHIVYNYADFLSVIYG